MARLRGPDGCPWDREQDFDTIRKHTLEESLRSARRDRAAQLAGPQGRAGRPAAASAFLFADGGRGWPLHGGRGDCRARIGNWCEGIRMCLGTRRRGLRETRLREISRRVASIRDKCLETGTRSSSAETASAGSDTAKPSRLDSVFRSTPALMEAAKLGSRASKAGFDWPDAQGLFSKIEEEAAELQEAVSAVETELIGGDPAVEEELGDLLFTVVNLARHLRVDPELALRRSNAKFRSRLYTWSWRQASRSRRLAPEDLEALWAGTPRLRRPAILDQMDDEFLFRAGNYKNYPQGRHGDAVSSCPLLGRFCPRQVQHWPNEPEGPVFGLRVPLYQALCNLDN